MNARRFWMIAVVVTALAAAPLVCAQDVERPGRGIKGGVPGGVKGGVPGGIPGGVVGAVPFGPDFDSEQAPGKGEQVSDDEELKLYALNSLRNNTPEEAIPMLERMLKSSASMKLKDKALSVLASYETTRARDVVAAAARDGADRDLQLKALRYLGRMEGEGTRKILADIYAGSKDIEVKKVVIRSLHSADDTARLEALARTEPDQELRIFAIRHLGAQEAQNALRQLYDAEQNFDVKAQILRALAVAEDQEKLAQVARTDKDPKMRREAVKQMSILDSTQVGETLVALYGSESDVEVRKEALRSLARQENAKALVTVARAEKDPELKKYAVSRLSQMHSKEATDFLVELLNK